MDPVGLSTFDVTLFVLALLVSVVIGLYFANKNNSLEEYMLGGKDQRLLPVSVSMMTSFMSGLTLIGGPAEMYYHGMMFSLITLGMLLHLPVSSFIFLPVFHRLESYSVFSYLELRYGKWIKRITSLVFMFQMTLYNAVVLYVPSLSLQSVLGISAEISIGLVGATCLVYCTVGGIKAVIWTDFFQAGLMYLALVCILIGGTIEAGGLSSVISANIAGNRLNMEEFFNFDLHTRHTIFNICTGSLIINLFMNGANQIQLQRALSLPSLRQAQLSQLYSSLLTVLISLMSSFIGLILYATYKDCDPFESGSIDKRDALLIYYVGSKLKYIPGLRGVFVAGIFAATLSTLSSFQNSMSALMLEDFIRPLFRPRQLGDKGETLLSKLIAFLFGVVCIGLTFVVDRFSGLLQLAYTLFGSLGAPFIASFLLGMTTRVTNACGATLGMLAGILFGVSVQLYQTFSLPALEPSQPISISGCPSNITITSWPFTPIREVAIENELAFFARMSYLWLPVISFVLTCVVAISMSLLTGGSKQHVDNKYLIGCLQKRPFDNYFDAERELKFCNTPPRLQVISANGARQLHMTPPTLPNDQRLAHKERRI